MCYNTGATILLQIFLDFLLLMGRNVKNSSKKFFVMGYFRGIQFFYIWWEILISHVTYDAPVYTKCHFRSYIKGAACAAFFRGYLAID